MRDENAVIQNQVDRWGEGQWNSRAGISRKIAMAISGHRTEAVYARSDPG